MSLDYWFIAANLLWAVGLAILLAVWSIGYYQSRSGSFTVSEYLQQPASIRAILAGLVLIFTGFAAVESRTLLTILWSVLALAAAVFLIYRK